MRHNLTENRAGINRSPRVGQVDLRSDCMICGRQIPADSVSGKKDRFPQVGCLHFRRR